MAYAKDLSLAETANTGRRHRDLATEATALLQMSAVVLQLIRSSG
jgi:hypothetical protein